MMSDGPRPAAVSDLYPSRARSVSLPAYAILWRPLTARLNRPLVARVAAGAVLLLVGAVAGAAAGQHLATRTAHRDGACVALNMAAALGYLDAEQQRRVRNALVTAINPDADLFAGLRPSAPEACRGGAGS